jgi:hypothetical protein
MRINNIGSDVETMKNSWLYPEIIVVAQNADRQRIIVNVSTR